MPKFRVTLSDGRVVTLESDQQPNEADVLMAIGQQSAPKQEPQIGPHPEAKISAGRGGEYFSGLPPAPDLEHRADANMLDIGGIGIAPETALMGVQAGRALLKPGMALAARGGELVSQATPIVKYYAVKKALTAMGIPADVAELAAVGVSSYRKGGAKAPAPESPGTVSVEGFPRAGTTAAPEVVPPRPIRGQLPAAPIELTAGPDPSFVRGVRADVVQVPRKMLSAHPSELPAAPDASYVRGVPAEYGESVRFNPTKAIQSARDAFTAIGEKPLPAEASNAMELIRRGKAPDEAVAIVLKNRPKTVDPAAAFNARFGTLTDDEVRAALDLRNAQGKIKTPSAETARSRR